MKLEVLEKDCFYHIYNRGINSGNIFNSEENKSYFLKLLSKYLDGKVTFLSYCLLDNHYHFLVKVNVDTKEITQAFSNFFNAYAKAFNKNTGRTGSLFEKHFKRKKIQDEEYLRNTIIYIHRNPENHNLINNFSDYNFSSYKKIVSNNNNNSLIDVNEVISLFENMDNFIFTHKNFRDENENQQNFRELAGDLKDIRVNTEKIKCKDTYKVLETLQDETLQDKTLQDKDLQENKISLKEQFFAYIENLQDQITSKLEEVDGKATFQEDNWKRKEGGGGRTRVIENGNLFEKGGVNISKVFGELPEPLRKQFGVKEGNFFACGLSLVLHPKNPFVPTVHANWRYFEMYDDKGNIVTQWFGGGQDLTPYYLFDEDATHFHTICKTACDRHNSEFYPKFKETCDNYFWNTHRNEARGIGGLFFDYLKETEEFSIQDRYNFVTEVGNSFLDSYVPIVEKRKHLEYTQKHKDWQEVRRGRYVEFNLVHDRGTLFGLKTNGRIESILMSLPPTVQWKYNHHPEENSEESKLLKVLAKPKDWV